MDTSETTPPIPNGYSAVSTPPSIDEMHLALSHIVHRREYRPLTPPTRFSPPDTNLEFLNLLALLLVTEAEGDVAAVTFRVLSKDRLELHYAKNRPCTSKETEYIRGLFEIISRDDRRECHNLCWDILSLVIAECEHKIKSRKNKLLRRLCEIRSPLATDGESTFAICANACTIETKNKLHASLGKSIFPITSTVPQLLCGWFAYLLKPEPVPAPWHVGSVHHMLSLAYYISHAPEMKRIMGAHLLRRVSKLGNYYRAALAIIRHAEQLPRDQLRQLRIVEAVPPAPEMRLLRTNHVEMVNAWARHVGEAGVSEEELRNAFPQVHKIPPKPTAMHAVCTHCECTLLLEMIKISAGSTPKPMLLEIGVSKSSCFMCKEFIARVQKHYRHIAVVVSSSYGKHVAGWSLPQSAPVRLRKVMERRVMDEMDNVLRWAKAESVWRARASWFALIPAPEKEEGYTGWGELCEKDFVCQ